MNHYPHHLGDYATGTQGFSQADHGAYRLLMDSYYSTEKPIPADDVYAISKAGTQAERKATEKVLARKFVLRDGLYHHKRIDEELEAFRARSKEATDKANRRWDKERAKKAPKEDAVAYAAASTQHPPEHDSQHGPGNAPPMLASSQEPVKPNTAFPVVTTPSEPPPNSGIEKNPRVETRRPGFLNLLRKHRVTGQDEHPLVVDRILTVAKDENIVQAFHEAGRAKGGAPYDIGFYATVVERIAKAADEAAEKLRTDAEAKVIATQAQISEQRERAQHAVPMPEALRTHLPRFGQ